MNARQLLDNILQILYAVKEDKRKLEKILQFLEDEVYEEPEEIEIAERYKNVVSQIADSIDAGLMCYLNPETLEMEDIPQRMLNYLEDFGALADESEERICFQHHDWGKCIIFEPYSHSTINRFRYSIESGFAGIFCTCRWDNP